MSWNGSGNGSTSPQRPKMTTRQRLLLAGLLVVILLALVAIFMNGHIVIFGSAVMAVVCPRHRIPYDQAHQPCVRCRQETRYLLIGTGVLGVITLTTLIWSLGAW